MASARRSFQLENLTCLLRRSGEGSTHAVQTELHFPWRLISPLETGTASILYRHTNTKQEVC